MPSRKYAKKLLLRFLSLVRQTLIAIGLPLLFAIKILLWTVYWLGIHTIKIFVNVWEIVCGTWETLFWLLKVVTDVAIEKPTGYWKKLKVGLTKKKLSKRQIRFQVPLPVFQKGLYILLGVVLSLVFLFIPYWIKSQIDQLPNPQLLTVRDIPVSTKIYDRSGILLYQIYSDENRTMVSLNDLPKYVTQATIAIEDKNYYSHLGFDLSGIVRAAFADANGEITQGGSTITQQLIKSALLSSEKTWERKIKEVIISFWAERIYSKEEILKMYLNQISYGGAAYGIESAAQTYFGVHAKELSLAQASFLAGLPSAPSTYSPYGSHPELAKTKQRQVLEAMVSQGYVTASEATTALNEPLKFSPVETSIKAPHFVMYVKDYLTKKYGSRLVERGGLEVTTSLDYPMYETTANILREGVLAQNYLNVGNGAVLITQPKTGQILAMVGSIDFFDTENDGNVNVTLAQRSPGSSIKSLNYALGFDKNLITPSTIIDDSPVVYKYSGGPDYAPQNYDSKFHGRVTIRTALGSSYNIPAVKVLEKNGVANFIDFARRAGISTFTDPNRYGLSLTLGGGEVTMTDMATAYSTFANNGERVNLNPILKITDYRGNNLENGEITKEKIISAQTAFLISDILADNNARTPAFGPSSALVIPGQTVSVKTGTAQDKRDNWTIGYTPSFLVAVWVGNNDNSPMNQALESGNTGAAAIWNPIMKMLLANKKDEGLARPDNLIPVQICAINGLLPCENCPYIKTEYFIKGTEPKQACKISKEEVEKILKPVENKN